MEMVLCNGFGELCTDEMEQINGVIHNENKQNGVTYSSILCFIIWFLQYTLYKQLDFQIDIIIVRSF